MGNKNCKWQNEGKNNIFSKNTHFWIIRHDKAFYGMYRIVRPIKFEQRLIENGCTGSTIVFTQPMVYYNKTNSFTVCCKGISAFQSLFLGGSHDAFGEMVYVSICKNASVWDNSEIEFCWNGRTATISNTYRTHGIRRNHPIWNTTRLVTPEILSDLIFETPPDL